MFRKASEHFAMRQPRQPFSLVSTRARGASGAMPTDLLDRREPPGRQMVRSTSRPSPIPFYGSLVGAARTCARSKISAVLFIRWRDGAERRAGLRPPGFVLRNRPWPPSYGVASTTTWSRQHGDGGPC
jgi:hypothetical protein